MCDQRSNRKMPPRECAWLHGYRLAAAPSSRTCASRSPDALEVEDWLAMVTGGNGLPEPGADDEAPGLASHG